MLCSLPIHYTEYGEQDNQGCRVSNILVTFIQRITTLENDGKMALDTRKDFTGVTAKQ